MKKITMEKAAKKTKSFLRAGGAFDRFNVEVVKAKKELKNHLDGGPANKLYASACDAERIEERKQLFPEEYAL